jgi:hypothetical protein
VPAEAVFESLLLVIDIPERKDERPDRQRAARLQ